MRTKTAARLSAIFIFTAAIPFSSCTFFKDSFNEPVKEYFKEYTETSGILGYEISTKDFVKGSDGSIIIPSSKDVTVNFYLRNPQRYAFETSSNMSFYMESLKVDEVEEVLGSQPDKSLVSISQDKSDYSVLKLVYPAEFLTSVDTGFDITPSVNMIHPVSRADFGTFSPVKIVCNSPPPAVYGAVVYKDSTNYYVLFNMPSESMLKGIHQDIQTLTINGKSTQVTINKTTGTFSFTNAAFVKGDAPDSIQKNSAEFEKYGQPVYFATGDGISDDDKSYTITVKDSYGLSSTVSTSVKSVRLEQVKITNKDGKSVLGGEKIPQDEDSSFATLTFTPAATAGDGKDTSDSIIVYEIYQGTDANGKFLLSGRGTGGAISVEVPCGKIFLRVYSHKDYFADSIPVTLGVDVLKSTIYVSPNGDDTGNNGSRSFPYKTVSKAISELTQEDNSGNKIILLGDIEENNVTIESNTNLTIDGKSHKITGNIGNSGNLTLADTVVLGTVEFTGGSLTLTGSTKVVGDTGNDGGTIEFNNNNLSITVDTNLTENIVARIELTDGYTKDSTVLKAVAGKELTQEICNKFITDDYVIKLKDGVGILAQSGGNIIVNISDGVSFAIPSEGGIALGKEITVTAKKDDTYITSQCTAWNIKVYNNGTDVTTKVNADGIKTNTFTLPKDTFPVGEYTILVVAEYNGKIYSATFIIEVNK